MSGHELEMPRESRGKKAVRRVVCGSRGTDLRPVQQGLKDGQAPVRVFRGF